MKTGLTIAFICSGNQHPSVENYKKFGHKYWDDAMSNNSKVGFYFAYYFQKKYVYIHKIINILQKNERPIEMINWEANRQILCLSERLKTFTWTEWVNGIGHGAPYATDYRNTQTGSWSYYELKNHKDFRRFDFIKFQKIIEEQIVPIVEEPFIVVEEPDDVIDDEETIISNHKVELDAIIKAQQEKTLMLLKANQEKKNRANISQLIADERDRLLSERNFIQTQINTLNSKMLEIDIEINAVVRGERNEELIKKKTECIKLGIITNI